MKLIKHLGTAADQEPMQERIPLASESPAAPFGAPRQRPRVALLTLILGAIVVGAAVLALIAHPTQSWLRHISAEGSCAQKRISTLQGREGTCQRVSGLFSSPTVYNVVDRSRVLRMPEYQARLLTSTITDTTVTGHIDRTYYPQGHGWLVSYEVAVTNRRAQPLMFGEAANDTSLPHYPTHPRVELLVPRSRSASASGSDEEYALRELLNGNGAPGPSIGLPRLIPGHGTITAWATFIAPEWSRGLLTARPADLDFRRTDNDSHYIGQIRLWK
jgi:hypothetical protein